MNPLIVGVPVQLDRERHLIFNFNALGKIEEALGESTLTGEFWLSVQQKPSARKLRAVIWGGLIAEDPSLTLEQVGAMLTPAKLGELIGPLYKSLNESLPQPEDEGGRPLPKSPPV